MCGSVCPFASSLAGERCVRAEWRAPRTQPPCRRNEVREIETLTRAAFSVGDESIKIELLRLLQGVDWPTASTILHLGYQNQYPIQDDRALWSLGYEKPPRYTMEFWLAYLKFTRGLAWKCDTAVRAPNNALWQYSKYNQS